MLTVLMSCAGDRLTIAYKQCLPHLRAMLFGEAEKVRAERTVQTIFRE